MQKEYLFRRQWGDGEERSGNILNVGHVESLQKGFQSVKCSPGASQMPIGLNGEKVCLLLPEAGKSMETVSTNISANELGVKRSRSAATEGTCPIPFILPWNSCTLTLSPKPECNLFEARYCVVVSWMTSLFSKPSNFTSF